MQEPAEVDVIILSWNRVEDTMAAIASTAEQKGVMQRILIVDQGSTAENLLRLKEFLQHVPSATLKVLGRNSGVAGGRNIAAAMGQAPCIVALDSDAVFADEWMLARAVAHLQAHENLCAIGFRIQNFFTRRNDETSWDYPAGCSPDKAFATTRFIGAGHAIRRATFEAVGGYDDRLFFCGEELDLCYRMLNTGQRIEYVPSVAILHKVSPEHRVFWGKGRFYFTVRNALYALYKFEVPWPRRVLAAVAYLVRGYRNGIIAEAARGILDSARLCRTFRQSREDKRFYRLGPQTLAYIQHCESGRRASLLVKIRRQWLALPHQE